MDANLLGSKYWPVHVQRVSGDVRTTFFKCVRWQVEETLDPIDCPYHYYCDSTYLGDYSRVVDGLVLLFSVASYLVTLIIMILEVSGKGKSRLCKLKRYLLPSSPLSLSAVLLILAKGHRINSIFPVSCMGPAIFRLALISALAFDEGMVGDIKYVIFQASTMSGILHASLYLDSVLLPYYTGFDALVSSTFSRECESCVCRREVLVVGGTLVTYRAWSITSFLVVGALCLRVICRVGSDVGKITYILKHSLETLGLASVVLDSMYLLRNSPPERILLRTTAAGAELTLICIYVIGRICARLRQSQLQHEK
ncbi:uncharacterized protein LOC115732518 [Rhodamnia argentea]|uniref:Uncharacterized protein LOC115732518 n=1 Tax=Rhodamnia argentea TaxID=178133 RepID=A0A8B8NAP5_9MYRT|nr:uncharacterized protein LOC115732518 [Rhodamnia argentea]